MMTREMRHHHGLWRWLQCALLLAGMMMAFTACGDDDEPKTQGIDYYIEVEEEFLVDGLVDHTDRYYSPVTMMKETIRNVYPKRTANGADEEVIAACDQLYQRYLTMYTGKAEHLTCLIHLVRAEMKGDVVKQSERLKSYAFDINPYEIDE